MIIRLFVRQSKKILLEFVKFVTKSVFYPQMIKRAHMRPFERLILSLFQDEDQASVDRPQPLIRARVSDTTQRYNAQTSAPIAAH